MIVKTTMKIPYFDNNVQLPVAYKIRTATGYTFYLVELTSAGSPPAKKDDLVLFKADSAPEFSTFVEVNQILGYTWILATNCIEIIETNKQARHLLKR